MRQHFWGYHEDLEPFGSPCRLGRSEQTSPHTVGVKNTGPGSPPGFGFIGRRRNPACAAGSPVGRRSLPVGAGPNQMETFFAFHLDQGGVDRSGEARVVQLDREVFAAFCGDLLPGGTEFDIAGEYAEVGSPVGRVFDADQLGLDVEVEGLDRTAEAVARGSEGADGSHVSYSFFVRAAPIATSMTVDGPEAIDRHPHGWNEVEGGRERLSWYARNGGGAVMGRKSQRPLPGQD